MSAQRQAEAILNKLFQLNLHKFSLLEEMFKVTFERNGLDEAEQAEEILAFFEVRQALMEKVDIIDAEIKELNRRYANLREEDNQPYTPSEPIASLWNKIVEQIGPCLKLVEGIQELDERQKPRLEKQLTDMKKFYERIKVGRQTLSAYRNKTSFPESVFIDKKE